MEGSKKKERESRGTNTACNGMIFDFNRMMQQRRRVGRACWLIDFSNSLLTEVRQI